MPVWSCCQKIGTEPRICRKLVMAMLLWDSTWRASKREVNHHIMLVKVVTHCDVVDYLLRFHVVGTVSSDVAA